MKRLLFVCPTGTLRFGGELSNLQLIKYLRSQGYDVEVFIAWKDDYYKELSKLNITTHIAPYAWWRPVGGKTEDKNTLAVRKMVKVISRFNPDIVITNTLNVPWGALAAALTSKPHIWIAREFAIGDFAYLQPRMDFVKAYSNAVVANSQELAKHLKEQFGIQENFFYSYVNATDLRLSDKPTPPKIIVPSQVNPRKNQLELMRALAILKKQDKAFDTQVVLLGAKDKQYWHILEQYIKKEKLGSLVRKMGHVREPWQLVGKNDILVQTSLSESIGRTTTEAMKLGVPVIASDIPGHQEAFRLGGGTLYELGNPADLAGKISHAVQHRDSLREKTIKIQEKVLTTMSEEACNQPFVEVMNTVKGKENPRKELRHLLSSLVVNVDEEMAERDRIIKWQEKRIKEIESQLQDLHSEIEDIRHNPMYRFSKIPSRISNTVNGEKGKKG